MDTWIWITAAAAAAVLLVVALVVWQGMRRRRRTRQLRNEFGGEYDYTLEQAGKRSKAEKELLDRKERVAQLDLRPLPEDEQHRYAEVWMSAQARFVDAPADAIRQADGLVAEVMELRGYPVGNFEEQAAVISVGHPDLVENYRGAHETAVKNAGGKATTEELRRAMVQFRDLFADLLEPRGTGATLSRPSEPRGSSPVEGR